MRSRPRPIAVACAVAALLTAVLGLGSPAHAQGPIGGAQMGTAGTVQARGSTALPAVSSPSFVVADLDSGAVYAARHPHLTSLPASCLKVLTALVLIPQLRPSYVVTAQDSDVNVDGTRVGIKPGGRYTVDQLFQALLMTSGNDAAELLARTNGGRRRTLDQMNAAARYLQADDTYAATPSGLEGPGQSTSAYDLALIARAAMKLPAFRAYVATRHVTFGAVGGTRFEIQNRNRLLRTDYPGALGIKDGWTTAAQHTFIGAARRGGRAFVVTLVRTDRTYGNQTRQLLDWAFAQAARPDVTPVGELVDPRPADQPSGANQRRAVPARSHRANTTALEVAGSLAALVAGLLVLGLVGRRRSARRRSW